MTKERRTNERASNGRREGKHPKLPPGVERFRDKYRARWPRLPWEDGSGRYRKGSPTTDLLLATREALEGRQRYEKAMAGHKAQRGEWTLAKAMQAVLDECERKGNRPATVRHYREHFRVLKRVWPRGLAPLRSISVEQVELFKNERGKEIVPGTDRRVSAQTVCHELQILSRCFEVAISKGYTGENPVKAVTRPRVRQTEPDYFVRSEVLAILDKIRATTLPRVDGDVDADLVLLLFTTALRRSEVARLKVGDINFERRTIRVDGKKRIRSIPIPKRMVPLLERIIVWPEKSYSRTSRNMLPLAGKGPAFTSEWIGEGRERYVLPGVTEEQRVNFVRRTFRRWRNELDEPRLHAHAMRHSFTTHLYACGYSLEFVSALAGHEKETRNAAHRYHRVLAPDRIGGMAMLWREPPEIDEGEFSEEVA